MSNAAPLLEDPPVHKRPFPRPSGGELVRANTVQFEWFRTDISVDPHGGLGKTDGEVKECFWYLSAVIAALAVCGKTILNAKTMHSESANVYYQVLNATSTPSVDFEYMHFFFRITELGNYASFPFVVALMARRKGTYFGQKSKVIAEILVHLSSYSLWIWLNCMTVGGLLSQWNNPRLSALRSMSAVNYMLCCGSYVVYVVLFLCVAINGVQYKLASIEMAQLTAANVNVIFICLFQLQFSAALSNPWIRFLGLLSQLVSVVNTDKLKLQQTIAIFFAGEDAHLDNDEFNYAQRYLCLVHDRIWRCKNLNAFQQFCCSLTINSEGIQRMMLVPKAS